MGRFVLMDQQNLGEDNKWGYFPAVGAAYKVINSKEGALNDIKAKRKLWYYW